MNDDRKNKNHHRSSEISINDDLVYFYVNLSSLAQRNENVIAKFYNKGLDLKMSSSSSSLHYRNRNHNSNNNNNNNNDNCNCRDAEITSTTLSLIDLCKHTWNKKKCKSEKFNITVAVAVFLFESVKRIHEQLSVFRRFEKKRFFITGVLMIVFLKITILRQLFLFVLGFLVREDFSFWLINLIDQVLSFQTPEIIEYWKSLNFFLFLFREYVLAI